MAEKKSAEFNVTGSVQGVGFRYFVYQNAQNLRLNGYAKNKYDGSVEVVVEGEDDKIKQLHEKLKQGPSRSRVQDVKVNYGDFRGTHSGFNIY